VQALCLESALTSNFRQLHHHHSQVRADAGKKEQHQRWWWVATIDRMSSKKRKSGPAAAPAAIPAAGAGAAAADPAPAVGAAAAVHMVGGDDEKVYKLENQWVGATAAGRPELEEAIRRLQAPVRAARECGGFARPAGHVRAARRAPRVGGRGSLRGATCVRHDNVCARGRRAETAFAVWIPKGGGGKTTMGLELSTMLAHLGVRTLVVDADPQCNLTSLLMAGIPAGGGDDGDDENAGEVPLPHLLPFDAAAVPADPGAARQHLSGLRGVIPQLELFEEVLPSAQRPMVSFEAPAGHNSPWQSFISVRSRGRACCAWV
jgi:hypothetical protein